MKLTSQDYLFIQAITEYPVYAKPSPKPWRHKDKKDIIYIFHEFLVYRKADL